ncbi:MAG: AraC family transcriptional regulator [Gemmatimonadota bacterium]
MTEAWFDPGAVLHPHTHARTIFGVMIKGSFETRIAKRSLDCQPHSVWTEPHEETHTNLVGDEGARVIVIEPVIEPAGPLEPLQPFLASVNYLHRSSLTLDAWRLVDEIRAPDALTPLAVEARVIGMLSFAARLRLICERGAKPAPWLLAARDCVHEHYRTGVLLREIAHTVGVDASHLARSFRRHFGMSIGSYARSLRLQSAVERITTTNLPLAQIALAAGYSDQSHLTRECKVRLGRTPAQLRAH